MLKTTLLTTCAVALLSLSAFGALPAQAKHHHHHDADFWLDLVLEDYNDDDCEYVAKKVKVKVWDDNGHYHYKWIWKDVEVCD